MPVHHPIVLFDGICNFCNGAVNFLIRQDKKGIIRFAALQSGPGQQLLKQNNLPTTGFQSFVLLHNGKVWQKSAAALHLVSFLPWYWQWAKLGWLLPPSLRDGLYNLIAKYRYRWFGKKDACMVPSRKVIGRFL